MTLCDGGRTDEYITGRSGNPAEQAAPMVPRYRWERRGLLGRSFTSRDTPAELQVSELIVLQGLAVDADIARAIMSIPAPGLLSVSATGAAPEGIPGVYELGHRDLDARPYYVRISTPPTVLRYDAIIARWKFVTAQGAELISCRGNASSSTLLPPSACATGSVAISTSCGVGTRLETGIGFLDNHTAVDAAACVASCTAVERCALFSFHSDSQQCRLGARGVQLARDDGTVFGHRQCTPVMSSPPPPGAPPTDATGSGSSLPAVVGAVSAVLMVLGCGIVLVLRRRWQAGGSTTGRVRVHTNPAFLQEERARRESVVSAAIHPIPSRESPLTFHLPRCRRRAPSSFASSARRRGWMPGATRWSKGRRERSTAHLEPMLAAAPFECLRPEWRTTGWQRGRRSRTTTARDRRLVLRITRWWTRHLRRGRWCTRVLTPNQRLSTRRPPMRPKLSCTARPHARARSL